MKIDKPLMFAVICPLLAVILYNIPYVSAGIKFRDLLFTVGIFMFIVLIGPNLVKKLNKILYKK